MLYVYVSVCAGGGVDFPYHFVSLFQSDRVVPILAIIVKAASVSIEVDVVRF